MTGVEAIDCSKRLSFQLERLQKNYFEALLVTTLVIIDYL